MSAIHSRRVLLNTSALFGALALSLAAAGGAMAQDHAYNIPAETLSQALRDYGRASGRQIIFTEDLVRGHRAPAVKGTYPSDAALARLLDGSGLSAQTSPSGAIMIVRDAGPQSDRAQPEPARPTALEEVVVTGSRIKGVSPSSPVITLTQDQIRQAGQTNVGEVIRSIPQNFTGGQNPGVTPGSTGGNIANQNLTGGSSINLRGLGPDASLTLLNGRRLAYDGLSQAIDVSNIPLAAISSIQIVTDGASAIYGSDAVAGVANIVLKRDFDGVTTSARYGAATEGGGAQGQYNIVFGKRWDTGGFIATADYSQQGQVLAGQRDVTANMPPATTLFPSAHQLAGLVSAHQDIGSSVHLSIDALYSDRKNFSHLDTPFFLADSNSDTKQFTVSPTIAVDLPHGWTASLNGVLAQDRNFYDEPTYDLTGVLLSPSYGCRCNNTRQAELDGEGPLFHLPGGDARLAIGAGYRDNWVDEISGVSGSVEHGDRRSTYAYGELNLPLVSAEQGIPLVRSLIVNGAVRYESYDDIGDIATPKLGVIWAPVSDIDIKASWGKSFKAPTLGQEHDPRYIELFPAAQLGGSAFPAGSTALLVGGGNPDLKPERADTVTAGLTWHPAAVPGLRIEGNYFYIRYTDRVINPVTNFGAVLSDPVFAQFITFNPTLAEQQAAFAAADNDYTGGAWNPANVVAIIHDGYTNVARQVIDGFDLSGSYSHPFGGGMLTAMGSASWLHANQQVSPGQPTVVTTGTVFNPPKFRMRAGLAWDRDAVTLSAYANHQSGLVNTTFTPNEQVDGLTTFDLTGIWRLSTGGGLLRDLEITLSAQNLFDAKPPFMRASAPYLTDYDSLNYSAIGRVVSLTVSKHW